MYDAGEIVAGIMAFDIAKFITRFVEETRDHISSLNRGLVEFEKNPEDHENINAIFRAAHTIKGSSRMLKLMAITEVAHKLEDALGALRDGRISYSRELAGLLFSGVDALSSMVERVADGGQGEMNNPSLCEALSKAASGGPAPERSEKESDRNENVRSESGDMARSEEESGSLQPHQQARPAATSDVIRVKSEKLDELIRLMGEIVSNQNRLKQRIRDIGALERESRKNLDICRKVCSDRAVSNVSSLSAGLKQLLFDMRQDKIFQDILSTEFQEKALMLRMVPLSVIFDPLHRLVRDISGSLGKDVDFIIEGGEIELDKKIIDRLSDPLVHMIRNAIDHGIELPVDRTKKGKPFRGRIRLKASCDAGNIIVELSDDGAGIPVSRIREKALEFRMFDASALEVMAEAELLDLIFLPGFSTSGIITDISGRGVGMDVVKKNIVEDLKGTVHVSSKEGAGSAFSIRLPMSLAIMRVLLLSCSGMKFGIASHYAAEIIRFRESDIIDVVGKKALRLREEFIPVTELAVLVGGVREKRTESKLVLISQIGFEKMGFIIDAILDEEDMVIKSLPVHMKKVKFVSGVTISGKNEVINILNMPSLMDAAKSSMQGVLQALSENAPDGEINILVVDDSVNTREIEKSILEAYGYSVRIAGDGMEALKMTGEFRYDLVITDVEMPRLDGFSLTEKLRADDSYRYVPVIIVTSREKDEDRRRGIAVGANAYIVKGSFDQSNLVDTVQNLIGRVKRI